MDNSVDYEYKLELYWADIPTEKSQAVTYDDLTQWWGTKEREVRKILQELSGFDNGDNYVLIRSSKSKGFYKTDNSEEIEKYKRECLNKGRSIFAPIKKINRILSANADQLSLTNNLRFVRESRKLQQTTVCAIMRNFDTAFDVPMLSKMENGICLPTYAQAARLAEIYQCEISDLINYEALFF